MGGSHTELNARPPGSINYNEWRIYFMDERIAQCTNWDIYHELMNEECNCPNAVLGLHDVYNDQVIRTFKPGAHCVFIVNPDNGRRDQLDKLTDQDFYGKYLQSYGRLSDGNNYKTGA